MIKVLEVAAAEVGYLEKSAEAYKQFGASCLYGKTVNAGKDNYTKYGYEMHQLAPEIMDFPAAWCDAFCDWCFKEAYGIEEAKRMIGGFDDYTKVSVAKYKAMGRFFVADPRPGDQIFFSRDGKQTGVYHTGLVEKVDKDFVYTIEGNTSDDAEVVPNGGGVYRKKYALTNAKIYGYGRPLYPDQWSWVLDGDTWYYQDGAGRNSYGWKLIRETGGTVSHWYFFDKTGAMLTGIQHINGNTYYLMEAGPFEGACCLTDSNGALQVWSL